MAVLSLFLRVLFSAAKIVSSLKKFAFVYSAKFAQGLTIWGFWIGNIALCQLVVSQEKDRHMKY